MNKKSGHVIAFMKSQGYSYDSITDSFKKPDESVFDFLKETMASKGEPNAR